MKTSTPSTDIFSAKLKKAREISKLSQNDLAKKANLQVSAISHFETGGRKPSFRNLKRLADALDVSIDYLLGRVVDASSDTMYRRYTGLSAEAQDMAADFIEMLAKKNTTKKQDGE